MKATKRTLRFGIIHHRRKLQQWEMNCIDYLLQVENTEFCLMLVIPHQKLKKTHLQRIFEIFANRQFPARNYERLDTVPMIDCQLDGNNVFSKETMMAIESYELDFIIHFSNNDIVQQLRTIPTYGVWEFSFRNKETPAFFWEMLRGKFVNSAYLFRLTDKKSEKDILREGHYAMIHSSYVKNRNNIYLSAANWPALVCQDIVHNKAIFMNKQSRYVYSEVERPPKNREWLAFSYQLLKNKFRKLVDQAFRYEYWNVGIVNKRIETFLDDKGEEIEWIIHQKDLYYADPFGYEDEQGIHILMEELDFRIGNGFISSSNISKKKEKSVVIQRAAIFLPVHMSYPFILHHQGEIYCIPETSEQKEVAMYRKNKKTKRWEKWHTLLTDFAAVDATVIQQGEFWWLFCTKASSHRQSHNNELHIFYAKSLFGKWTPHARNPVKIDIRSSRPAGTPFYYQDKLYRPSQDCSKTYGGRININKVTILTPTQFNEVPVSIVEPRKGTMYADGVHTISSLGDMTLIDAKRIDYRLSHLWKKLHQIRKANMNKQPIDEVSSQSIINH